MWNAPLPNHADGFLTKCLVEHFGVDKKWHSYYIDNQNRTRVSVTFEVVDKVLKEETKMSFMT